MKIRMHDDAIRFRLNRNDVSEFSSTGRVSASVHFGTATLSYTLSSTTGAALQAHFDGNEIRIDVPQSLAATWTASDEVGIEGHQPAGGRTLAIVIEKDFQCMHKGEEHKDPAAYPNPMATA